MKSVLKYYAKLDALLDAQIFFIALELDMFTVLSNGKTAEELAEVISCNADKYGSLNLGNAQSLKIFLDVLVAQGLITVDGECYYNTDETQRFLVQSSVSYIGDVLLYRKRLSDICDGTKTVSETTSDQPVFDFAEMARITAREIAVLRKEPLLMLIKKLDLTPQRILDLGGGSGSLLIAIAETYKKCEGVLFEQKDVASIARRFIADSPAKNRIAIMEGNFLLDGIGDDYDLIIASGIFPFALEMIEPFVKKISNALQKGGLLLVYDTAFAAEKDKARYAARWLKGNLRRKNQQLRCRAPRDENFRINKALSKEMLISALHSVNLKAIMKGTDGLYPFIVFRKVCSDK